MAIKVVEAGSIGQAGQRCVGAHLILVREREPKVVHHVGVPQALQNGGLVQELRLLLLPLVVQDLDRRLRPVPLRLEDLSGTHTILLDNLTEVCTLRLQRMAQPGW